MKKKKTVLLAKCTPEACALCAQAYTVHLHCPIIRMTVYIVLLALKSDYWWPFTFENFVTVLINFVKYSDRPK